MFCRPSLHWNLPAVFLMIWRGCGFCEEDHRGRKPFPSHYIKQTVCHLLPTPRSPQPSSERAQPHPDPLTGSLLVAEAEAALLPGLCHETVRRGAGDG